MQFEFNNVFNVELDFEKALSTAVELFNSGKIFIYPTDTIYGIGGNPFDENVIQRIAEVKGRDDKKQFIWLLSDFENLMNYVDIIFESHIEFLQQISPAPVSVILNLNERTSTITNQGTVAVRIPKNDFCLKLLKEISRPLISTSVNKSGHAAINHIGEIVENFSSDVDAIFYNTEITQNKSSTIIDLTSEKPVLIREGDVKFVDLLRYFS